MRINQDITLAARYHQKSTEVQSLGTCPPGPPSLCPPSLVLA